MNDLCDFEWPLHTLLHFACVFGVHCMNLNEDRPIIYAEKM